MLQKSAKQNAQKAYQEVLKKQGLNEEILTEVFTPKDVRASRTSLRSPSVNSENLSSFSHKVKPTIRQVNPEKDSIVEENVGHKMSTLEAETALTSIGLKATSSVHSNEIDGEGFFNHEL